MYKDRNNSWVKNLDFIILDILCLQISYILAYISRLGFRNPYTDIPYARIAIVFVFIDICVMFFDEGYTAILRRGYLKEFTAVVKYVVEIMMIMLLYLFVIKESEVYSRIVIMQTWLIATILIYFERIFWKKIVKKRILQNKDRRQILVVVSSEVAESVVEKLKSSLEFHIAGIVLSDNKNDIKSLCGIDVILNMKEALEYIRTNVVDGIFFESYKDSGEEKELLKSCTTMGVPVHLALHMLDDEIGEKKIERLANYTVLTNCVRIVGPRQMLIKRTMDICGGLVGLVITAIIFIIFAPIIYIQSPGPIFFSQTRIGKNGRKFKIYKFRSMYMDAEERKKELMEQNKMQGLMFKMDDDPRIIPIGKFMRNTSLDEFPQMWNVLKGDMSLVGTRPPTEDEYNQYEIHHKKRLATKPGLTGMWQVSGRSDILDFEEVKIGYTIYFRMEHCIGY